MSAEVHRLPTSIPGAGESKRGWANAIEQLRAGAKRPMAEWLRAHLFGHVLPFWEKHAFDEQGGLLTCLGDAGELISTDKWLWSQWRAVWVFARIYNRIDRDPRWLQRARAIAEFCLRHGWIKQAEGWALVIARDGKILRGYESTYVDAFAVYGLTELYKADGGEDARHFAQRTADAALKKLAGPYDAIPHFPYPIPTGVKPHGIPMLWSLTLAELGHTLRDERYLQAAARLSEEIFRDFFRPDRDLFLEFVQADGREFQRPQGTAIVPGHVIEDLWFQLHVAQRVGRSPIPVDSIMRMLLRHLELGWDRASGGGILLALDADGQEPVGWNFAHTKLWWPHTEALYATLLMSQLSGRTTFVDWYERVWRFCLEHFVDWEHGEWRQKLDRSCAPLQGVVTLPDQGSVSPPS